MLQSIELMKAQASKAPHLWLVIAGIVGILAGGSGLNAVMVRLPSLTAAADAGAAEDEATPPGIPAYGVAGSPLSPRGTTKCAECGVIGSTRKIRYLGEPGREGIEPVAANRAMTDGREEMASPSWSYEVTVRMQDGSSRVFTESSPASWREGERVIVIEGAIPLGN